MAFQSAYIPRRRGRPPHRDCVTASTNGARIIAVMLSGDIADQLGVSGNQDFRIELGTGVDSGKLRVSRARLGDGARVPAFKNGQKVGFNLRRAFMPDAVAPQRATSLPHVWRDATLIIDLAPLARCKRSAA